MKIYEYFGNYYYTESEVDDAITKRNSERFKDEMPSDVFDYAWDFDVKVTEVSKIEMLESWAERQASVLKSIREDGFDEVIGSSNESFSEWVEFEFEFLLRLINSTEEELATIMYGE